MRYRLAALVTISCLLSPGVIAASERSKLLSSRALVEFHAAHYAQALELFQQALDDDPTDVYARYYRAATRARLDDYDGAIADLRVVLAAQPDFNEAALDLGVALIETKQYQEALPWLEQAQRSAGLDARASLFLGIAYLRSGQLQRARENFHRAASDPEQSLTVRYYEGVISYQEGNRAAAGEHFAAVLAASPDSALGREAQAFLVKLGAIERRRYQLYGTVGMAYDSNVILAPSANAGLQESILRVSQQSDVLSIISAGGVGVPWRGAGTELSVGYDFYQSYHIKLPEFDLQDHGPSVQVASEVGPVRMGLLGRYDYYLLDTQSFLQAATAFPWLMIPTGRLGQFDLTFRMLRNDYKNVTYSVRDSFNYAASMRQLLFLGSPDRYCAIGYRFDQEDPVISQRLVSDGVFTDTDAESFAYNGNEVNATLGWLLPMAVVAESSFAYRHEGYASASASPPFTDRRRDNEYLVTTALRKQIWDHFDVALFYVGDINNSNHSPFQYERHIVSLVLEGRY